MRAPKNFDVEIEEYELSVLEPRLKAFRLTIELVRDVPRTKGRKRTYVVQKLQIDSLKKQCVGISDMEPRSALSGRKEWSNKQRFSTPAGRVLVCHKSSWFSDGFRSDANHMSVDVPYAFLM